MLCEKKEIIIFLAFTVILDQLQHFFKSLHFYSH